MEYAGIVDTELSQGCGHTCGVDVWTVDPRRNDLVSSSSVKLCRKKETTDALGDR